MGWDGFSWRTEVSRLAFPSPSTPRTNLNETNGVTRVLLRLDANDSVDPYVAVYSPPTPSRIGTLTHIRWTGLLSPVFVQNVIDAALNQNQSVGTYPPSSLCISFSLMVVYFTPTQLGTWPFYINHITCMHHLPSHVHPCNVNPGERTTCPAPAKRRRGHLVSVSCTGGAGSGDSGREKQSCGCAYRSGPVGVG